MSVRTRGRVAAEEGDGGVEIGWAAHTFHVGEMPRSIVWQQDSLADDMRDL